MKKRVLLIVLGATLFALPLTAQESWVRFYEAEDWEETEALCVIQTSDGGYAIYSHYWAHGEWDQVWLLMTNPQGDTLWTRKYENTASWSSDPLIELTDGSYALTGVKHTGETYDVWLCKAGPYGDVIWERYIDLGKGLHEYGSSVQQTADGGCVVVGFTQRPDPLESDVLLIKTDADGDTVWTRTYGTEGTGASVRQTTDGGYVIAGRFGSYPNPPEICLLKTDYLGQEEWKRTYGEGWALCMEQTTDDGYIVAADPTVIKTDSVGDVEWTRDFGSEAECVRQTFEGGYILGGIAGTKLIKLDPDGNVLWEKIREFHIYSVRQTTDGGYILTGAGGYSDGYHEYHYGIFLCKTDSTGYAPKLSGIAEPATPPVPVTQPDWQIVNSVGSRIVLRYTNRPQGFTAFIFDITGKKVGEIHTPLPSGTLTWGDTAPEGVYFIRSMGESAITKKAVIIK